LENRKRDDKEVRRSCRDRARKIADYIEEMRKNRERNIEDTQGNIQTKQYKIEFSDKQRFIKQLKEGLFQIRKAESNPKESRFDKYIMAFVYSNPETNTNITLNKKSNYAPQS